MAKKQAEQPAAAQVALPADAGCAVYRDKAGVKLGGGPSEGAANFGAITAEAIKSVAEAQASAAPDVAVES